MFEAWFGELGSGGHLTDPSHRTGLEIASRVVRGHEKTMGDGPYAEAKDVVSGYARIEAQDLAEAVELSKGCPIVDVGGSEQRW